MKSVSYDDEKKWERLQRMRKASKKKEVRDKVEEGKLTSVKATTYGMPPEERKALIDAERKRLGVKPKPEKKVQVEAKVDTGSPEAKASARNVRNTPPGKDYKFDTSVFITRKPGESLDSARTRKRRDAHAAKRGMKEDRALDIVRANIIKKHGEGAIYDAKRDAPTEAQKKSAAAERKKRAEADKKAFADRAKKAGYKNPQDYANVVAQYGSEDNMKKGKGLGT